VVDDAGDAAYDGSFLVAGQPVGSFAEFKGVILPGVKLVKVAALERRDVIRIVLVQCVRKVDELFQVLSGDDFLYGYFHG